MRNQKIDWGGLLKIAIDNYPNEVCGMLFASRPYTESEIWYVVPIKNIAPNPKERWMPDRKEVQRIKKDAKKKERVRIGNIHTHPLPEGAKPTEDNIEFLRYHSDEDLRYAQKFHDVVRGIIVVDNINGILGYRFHDMFGHEMPLFFEAI